MRHCPFVKSVVLLCAPVVRAAWCVPPAAAADERVKVDSYYTGVEFYYEFLKALTTRKH